MRRVDYLLLALAAGSFVGFVLWSSPNCRNFPSHGLPCEFYIPADQIAWLAVFFLALIAVIARLAWRLWRSRATA